MNLSGAFLLTLDSQTILTKTTSTKDTIGAILANTASVFSTCITVFTFIKKFFYNREHNNQSHVSFTDLEKNKEIGEANPTEINHRLAELRKKHIEMV